MLRILKTEFICYFTHGLVDLKDSFPGNVHNLQMNIFQISIYSIAAIKPVKMVGEPVFCISLIDANSLNFAS